MYSLTFFALLLTAALTSADKPVVFPNPGLSVLDDGFRSQPSTGVRSINTADWTERIPEDCARESLAVQGNGNVRCPLDQLDVFEVHYADVPENAAWLFCRCRDADYSQETLVEEFGRIPAGIRQRVRYVMNFKGTSGGASNNNDLMLQQVSPTVILHEAAHAFDDAGSKSGQAVFGNSIESDTCWADNYAKSTGESGNHADPWAQVLVLRRYQVQVGPLPKSDDELACMSNQLATVAGQTDGLVESGFDYALKRPYGTIKNRSDYQTKKPQSAKFRY